jgi:TolB protein
VAAAQLPFIEPAPQQKARIAFVADDAVHTIAADGSDRRRLSPPEAEDADPAWSPAGDTIAFARYDDKQGEGDARLWLVRPDGSDARRLFATQPRGRNDFSPAWSPDGARIAFSRVRVGKDRYAMSIVSAAADGSDQRTVYSEAANVDDENADVAFLYSPAWSPDGQHILFTRTEEGLATADDLRPSLYLAPAAGGNARRLARDARDGVWSPDGARIAFTGVRTGRACEGECEFAGDLYVMSADGTGKTQLTKSKADDAEPSWSGDGERIVFHSDRNSLQADFEDSPAELYSVKPDGSCLTWLTNGTAHSRSAAFEPGAGLSSDPGGCEPPAREPLVETPTGEVDAHDAFPLFWLGRVAPNGLLLSEAEVDRTGAWFSYRDCGRFDPGECGEFLDVFAHDLCAGGRPLRFAGHRNSPLTMTRGALLNEQRQDEFGSLNLYTGRTWLSIDTASGAQPSASLLDGVRRVGAEHNPAATLPSTRLPVKFWRTLTRVTAAQRRLHAINAVARRLKLSRGEVKRRLAVARRLAELGVKRRLGC